MSASYRRSPAIDRRTQRTAESDMKAGQAYYGRQWVTPDTLREDAPYFGRPRYPDDGPALAHLATAEDRQYFRLAMGNAGLYRCEAQFREDAARISMRPEQET